VSSRTVARAGKQALLLLVLVGTVSWWPAAVPGPARSPLFASPSRSTRWKVELSSSALFVVDRATGSCGLESGEIVSACAAGYALDAVGAANVTGPMKARTRARHFDAGGIVDGSTSVRCFGMFSSLLRYVRKGDREK
jgi:hypothetical protein